MNWRWYLFWINDFIQGGKIRKAYKDIKKNYYNFDGDSQKQKLLNLLSYAKSNSEFYKKYDDKNIFNFPIINKQIIKDNYNIILIKSYERNKLYEMSTSGSTGTPLTILQDKLKKERVIAEVIFFGEIADYKFGNKQIYLRAWVDKIHKNIIRKFFQNMIAFDVTKLNNDNLEKLIKLMQHKKVKNILSYASTLELLKKYIENNSLNISNSGIKSCISGSEMLNEKVREKLSQVYNCKVFSRYSNEENGILGQDLGEQTGFYMNHADYFIEFLKLDSDEYAEKGDVCRIVITDLYNYAMPMIRYDTGDTAIYDEKDGVKYIKELFGRRVDIIYDTKNQPVSPHSITNNMWELDEIQQFKFIQMKKRIYLIQINTKKQIDENKIISSLKKILGNDANIQIEYVEEVTVLASGKRKYIENRMKGK